jgi:uncharacterized protein
MKKFKKIILAGGSGQVGKAIVTHLKANCDEIIILSREESKATNTIRKVQWDGKNSGKWEEELEGADVLVNLTGKNVNCRHNTVNRKLILDSRIDSIKALTKALEKCKTPPKLWIQAASAAIYKHKLYRPMNESETETGEGFMVDVSKAWENTFNESTSQFKNLRKVILRISLVLGKKEGVFPRLKLLVTCGMGGKAGNGKQYMSWIHEADLAKVVEWIATNPEIEGPINCATPNALTNAEFMALLRKKQGMPIGLPAPELALKFGAAIIGTEASLVLDSMWAVPDKLTKSGFQFDYPDLSSAVNQLIKEL